MGIIRYGWNSGLIVNGALNKTYHLMEMRSIKYCVVKCLCNRVLYSLLTANTTMTILKKPNNNASGEWSISVIRFVRGLSTSTYASYCQFLMFGRVKFQFGELNMNIH